MSISFNVVDEGKKIQVLYDENITCENFIQDFLKKQGSYVTLDVSIYTFRLGPKILNLPRFLHKPIKEILRNGCTVTLIRKKDCIYGGGPTINLTDGSVKKGINIYGICKTKNCVECGNIVISSKHKDKINMMEEKYEFTCSKCGGIIEPKIVVFYLCKYRIYGSKIENKTVIDFDNGISDVNDKNDYSHFDELENGNTKFVDLIFEVISYH